MIKFVIRVLRRARRKYISDNSVMLPLIRRAYQLLLSDNKVFERHGIPIDIGGYGYFRLHPKLVVGTYNFEQWGSGHNSGFQQWVEECRGKRVVFDIGAHVGLYTLPASRVLAPGGTLYAFEPGNVNREFLKRHIEYNAISNVEVVADLIGDVEAREIPFFESKSVHGMNTVVQDSLSHKSKALEFREALKNQIRLDDFCQARGITPEVIKMDVEGAELKILRGASAILRHTHPCIFLSVHPAHLLRLRSSAEDLYAFIRDLGYVVYTAEGRPVRELKKEEYILRY